MPPAFDYMGNPTGNMQSGGGNDEVGASVLSPYAKLGHHVQRDEAGIYSTPQVVPNKAVPLLPSSANYNSNEQAQV